MEQLSNDYSGPLFIINNDNNIIISFTNSLINSLCKYFIYISYLFYIITKFTIMTISFIILNLTTEIVNRVQNFKLTPEIAVFVLTFLILGSLIKLDHQMRMLDEQKKQIEFLKKSVNYLNNTDYMRDELVYLKEQMNSNYNDTTNRLSNIDKKIKKIKQEIKNL